MKIVSVHNTHQHRGGEDVVFEQEKRMCYVALDESLFHSTKISLEEPAMKDRHVSGWNKDSPSWDMRETE